MAHSDIPVVLVLGHGPRYGIESIEGASAALEAMQDLEWTHKQLVFFPFVPFFLLLSFTLNYQTVF
jgi:hypothetical protein